MFKGFDFGGESGDTVERRGHFGHKRALENSRRMRAVNAFYGNLNKDRITNKNVGGGGATIAGLQPACVFYAGHSRGVASG